MYQIIALLLFLMLALIFLVFKLKIKISRMNEEVMLLVEGKEDVEKEFEKKRNENIFLINNVEKLYELVEKKSGIDQKTVKDLEMLSRDRIDIFSTIELSNRVVEEMIRKDRYPFLKFSIMEISLDFYNEYKKIYGFNNTILEELIFRIENRIRKIDFLSYGKSVNRLYLLLPLTDLAGAVILAERIQEFATNLDKKNIVTLTISVCEIEEEKDVERIFSYLESLIELGEKSGGNSIKVKKC